MAGHKGGGNKRGRKASSAACASCLRGSSRPGTWGRIGCSYRAPTTFQTRGDANAYLALRQPEIIRAEWMPPEFTTVKPCVTFAEFSHEWLIHRQLKPRTRADYRRVLERFLLPAFGDRPLVEITRSEVRDWYAGLSPSAPTMRMHAYGLLRTILGSAVTDELIAINPAYIRGAGNVERSKEPRPATVEELSVIAASVPERYRLMVLLAAWCALRFGELVELRVKDIDYRNQLVRVRRAAVRVDGVVVIGSPKSRAGVRDVTIPPHLLPIVKDHIRALPGTGGERLLFPGADGVSTMNPSTLYKVYYPARARAGRPDLRFHDLRQAGAKSVQQVAERTGQHWAAKHVVKSIPSAKINAVNKVLGRYFVTKYGTKQGIVVLGRVIPFGIGAAIGGAANAAFCQGIIKASDRAFGPAPEDWAEV